MEDLRAVLEEAFGESSSSEDDVQVEDTNDEDQFNWERVGEIKGLWICREFLSPDQQSSLLSAIDKEGWFTEASHNQAMRFGDLPLWATELANLIREVVHYDDHASETVDMVDDKEACILPSNILWREPLFDQLIVNVYQPGEGICAHVDLMRFDDGIAIVSLESSCVMHFTRVNSESLNSGKEEDSSPPAAKIPVYLTPGSLVIMWGEARYQWMHEINRKPGFQKWEEKDIDQRRRTSITLRKLI